MMAIVKKCVFFFNDGYVGAHECHMMKWGSHYHYARCSLISHNTMGISWGLLSLCLKCHGNSHDWKSFQLAIFLRISQVGDEEFAANSGDHQHVGADH